MAAQTLSAAGRNTLLPGRLHRYAHALLRFASTFYRESVKRHNQKKVGTIERERCGQFGALMCAQKGSFEEVPVREPGKEITQQEIRRQSRTAFIGRLI